MARTGLRMMPTFPSSPLKFRTVSFPQSGFKASLSGRACPDGGAVEPAPGMPATSSGLHRPFARVRRGTPLPGSESRRARASACRCARDRVSLPQGSLAPVRVMLSRSIIAYYDPIRQSRRHAAISRLAAYTPRLRCAGAPRRPMRPSLLSLPCSPHVPSTLRRWVRGGFPVVLPPRCGGCRLPEEGLLFSKQVFAVPKGHPPSIDFAEGLIFLLGKGEG